MCKPQDLSGHKIIKLIKKGKRSIINDPTILFNKNKHTINLHFNMFHIYNGLDDLARKILFYKKNDKSRKKIAYNGKKKYFKLFNEKRISKYIIEKSFNNKISLF